MDELAPETVVRLIQEAEVTNTSHDIEIYLQPLYPVQLISHNIDYMSAEIIRIPLPGTLSFNDLDWGMHHELMVSYHSPKKQKKKSHASSVFIYDYCSLARSI